MPAIASCTESAVGDVVIQFAPASGSGKHRRRHTERCINCCSLGFGRFVVGALVVDGVSSGGLNANGRCLELCGPGFGVPGVERQDVDVSIIWRVDRHEDEALAQALGEPDRNLDGSTS